MRCKPITNAYDESFYFFTFQAVINAELMDYHGYLNVKVQRNITMTSYIDDFPGLVHFIFVDRHFHQMTAPSFNITLKEGESMDATSYLKKKVGLFHINNCN